MSESATTRIQAQDLRIGDHIALVHTTGARSDLTAYVGMVEITDDVVEVLATEGQSGFYPPSAPVTIIAR